MAFTSGFGYMNMIYQYIQKYSDFKLIRIFGISLGCSIQLFVDKTTNVWGQNIDRDVIL